LVVTAGTLDEFNERFDDLVAEDRGVAVDVVLNVHAKHVANVGHKVETLGALVPVRVLLLSQMVLQLRVMPFAEQLQEPQHTDAHEHDSLFVVLHVLLLNILITFGFFVHVDSVLTRLNAHQVVIAVLFFYLFSDGYTTQLDVFSKLSISFFVAWRFLGLVTQLHLEDHLEFGVLLGEELLG